MAGTQMWESHSLDHEPLHVEHGLAQFESQNSAHLQAIAVS